jgi:hypothetical protein
MWGFPATFRQNGFVDSIEGCAMHISRRVSIFLSALALVFSHTDAAPFQSKFAVVVVDAQTEAKIGGFPSRAVLSQLIDRIAAGKPKSIILKYFLNTPGNEADSMRLAQSIGNTRVILQATINKEPPTSQSLDERFFFSGPLGLLKPALAGDEGWLPQKRFADHATQVCFVDVVKPEQVPMLELFHQRPVESLYACALAEAFGESKLQTDRHRITFGDQSLALNEAAEVNIRLDNLDMPANTPAFQLLDAKFDSAIFTEKVVILAYTGSRSPTLDVRGSSIPVHQLFLAQLRELVAKLR